MATVCYNNLMEKQTSELNLQAYAHLGDAVYELFVRKKIVYLTAKPNKMHQYTTSLVCATYQAELLNKLVPDLTEEEHDLIRRARNLSLTQNKKTNQAIHRQATALEVLIGYLYINNPPRYSEIIEQIASTIDFENIGGFAE